MSSIRTRRVWLELDVEAPSTAEAEAVAKDFVAQAELARLCYVFPTGAITAIRASSRPVAGYGTKPVYTASELAALMAAAEATKTAPD